MADSYINWDNKLGKWNSLGLEMSDNLDDKASWSIMFDYNWWVVYAGVLYTYEG